MICSIRNDKLVLSADTRGAEIVSLFSAGGTEFIWQGDPDIWEEHAPNLFPFIARLTDNSYTYRGKTYPMRSHGFAKRSDFTVYSHTEDTLVFELTNDAATESIYPFAFCLRIGYRLTGNTAEITYHVENKGDEPLPFAIGGHTGFCVAAENEKFEDYSLEFSESCTPDRIGFTENVFLSGHNTLYPLKDGKSIPLSHDLFDDDAIILQNTAKEITLRSEKSSRSVRVSFPDFRYLGLWHRPHTGANYVCIEPWTSLPSRQGIVEDFACKSDMLHLAAGRSYDNVWTVTVTD